jgi:hypothetical protein
LQIFPSCSPRTDDAIVVSDETKGEETMIRGLQITMAAEGLKNRIGERITEHEAEMARLAGRIKEREGDLPIDVRMEDNFATVPDLQQEWRKHRDHVTKLSLLRDGLIPGETYAMRAGDLRLTEVISPEQVEAAGIQNDFWPEDKKKTTIQGLKLTMPGDEVRRLLDERITVHEARAARWKREQTRGVEDQTEDEPVLPTHMCENEEEEEHWRVAMLTFIRDHIEQGAIYRLGERDLQFGELLPEKPVWMEQAEYEERTAVGFNLERLTRELRGAGSMAYVLGAPTGSTEE